MNNTEPGSKKAFTTLITALPGIEAMDKIKLPGMKNQGKVILGLKLK
jgi:hypothetical protein